MNALGRTLIGLGSVAVILGIVWGLIWTFSRLVESTALGAVVGYLALFIVLILIALPIGFFGIFGLLIAGLSGD